METELMRRVLEALKRYKCIRGVRVKVSKCRVTAMVLLCNGQAEEIAGQRALEDPAAHEERKESEEHYEHEEVEGYGEHVGQGRHA
jgi:hypothetical protein